MYNVLASVASLRPVVDMPGTRGRFHRNTQLGEVTFNRGTSISTVTEALSLAQQAEKSKAAAFTNYILSEMLANPSMTSTEVAVLPDYVANELVATAAEVLNFQEEFDSVSPDFPAQERFYQAYQKWFSNTIGVVAVGFVEQARARLISALAPDQFNLPVSSFDYGSLATSFVESLQAATDTMSASMQRTFQRVREEFAQIKEAIQQRLDAVELDASVVAPLLAATNLWISPSIPLDLLHILREVVEEENATPETVEELFLEFFRADEWIELKEMVLSWESNSHFEDRMPIILDALQAHINGHFTLSVPALLPHVEGITSDILGVSVSYGTGQHVRGILERELPEYLHSVSRDILIEYVTRVVYERTDFNNFVSDLQSRGLVETDFLNRHAILHGVHTNYANEGLSLRVFLLLDAFSTV